MGIIVRDGVAGLSMSGLAASAGISRQALYSYFADVEAVLAAMAALASDTINELASAIETQDDPRAGLRLLVGGVLGAAAAGFPSPVLLASTLPAAMRSSVEAHQRSADALVISLLRRGRDAGVFRADLDPELDGRIICRAVIAMHDLASERALDIEDLADHLAANLLRIVTVPAPASGS